jgi:1,4-dihydroxy-2-naphthoate octaprenyltransferase
MVWAFFCFFEGWAWFGGKFGMGLLGFGKLSVTGT